MNWFKRLKTNWDFNRRCGRIWKEIDKWEDVQRHLRDVEPDTMDSTDKELVVMALVRRHQLYAELKEIKYQKHKIKLARILGDSPQ